MLEFSELTISSCINIEDYLEPLQELLEKSLNLDPEWRAKPLYLAQKTSSFGAKVVSALLISIAIFILFIVGETI